jgi:hypothetical protein
LQASTNLLIAALNLTISVDLERLMRPVLTEYVSADSACGRRDNAKIIERIVRNSWWVFISFFCGFFWVFLRFFEAYKKVKLD